MTKICLRVNIEEPKTIERIGKLIKGIEGVETIAITGGPKERITTVIGDTDPVSLCRVLKENGFSPELLSVGPTREEKVSMATMPSSILQLGILQAIGKWLADHTLDELIAKTSGPFIEKKDKADSELDELIEKTSGSFIEKKDKADSDLGIITPAIIKRGILYFIEKMDKADSERMMWGLLRTYNQIFMEANVLLYFKRISGVIFMGGVIENHGGFPNLHKFWEMIVGKKIFSSQLSLKIPEVHPEARALLRTQMMLLMEYAGLTREAALAMIDKNWREELRMEINYHYGHYWETPCCVLDPRKVSLDMFCRNGRIWDAAEDKWYARVRQIYKEEILDKAAEKAPLDPTPKGLTCNNPPTEYEEASIDANADWFNEDAERSAQELWKILESKNEWPGWDEARKYWNLKPRDLSIKIPLIPKK